MREHRARLTRHNEVAKTMDYVLEHWGAFTRFLDDGRSASRTTPQSSRRATENSAARFTRASLTITRIARCE
jgi:hypothetical protein